MLKIILASILVATSMGSPTGYGQSGQQGQQVPESLDGRSAYDNEPPRPYDFSYQISDYSGNQQSRQESGDNNGNIRGSYGYNNVDGISRQVEYVADDGGFRATIKTNEPGTKSESPADVQIEANPVTGRSGYNQQSGQGYGQGLNVGSSAQHSGGYGQQSQGSFGGQFHSGGVRQQGLNQRSDAFDNDGSVQLRTYAKSNH